MAGFFGFFDFTKEGPGISKKGPQKKGFFVFFEIYVQNFWEFVKASLLFLLLSIPLVTYGIASVGLTHITRSAAREKHSFILSDFFDTVKKNWKQSLIAGILNTLITAILLYDIYLFYAQLAKGLFSIIGLGVSLFFFFTFTAMKYYLWVLMITFDLPLTKIYRNSFHFVFLNLGRNVMLELVLFLCYAAVYVIYVTLGGIGLFITMVSTLFIFPAFKSYLVQANVFPSIKKHIIDPYYAEHPGEDIEKRRLLGLELSEDETGEPESEPIFSDETPDKKK